MSKKSPTPGKKRKKRKPEETYGLIEAGCEFWFNDNDQVRSPFPRNIQTELKKKATAEYMLWVRGFTKEDREEVDEDELVGVFEMFLFGEALKLIGDDDQLVITINYPFLPRLDDTVNDGKHAPSVVVDRQLEERTVENDEKKLFMIIHMSETDSGKRWTSEIQLPT